MGDSTKKVWNNPYGYDYGSTIKTGYVGNSADVSTNYTSSTAPSNIIEHNKIDITKSLNGTKASTTGTVYGVYDMAGGSWEYVAGCLNGQENSKFGVAAGDSKYVDLYTSSSIYDGAKIGDTTKETKGWNDDFSDYFVNSSSPIFLRGRLFLRWYECRLLCL